MAAAKERLLTALRWSLRACAPIALLSLLVEFGWPLKSWVVSGLHGIDLVIMAVFVGDVLLRTATASDRRAHIRRHWLELLLIALLAVHAVGFAIFASGMLIRLYVVGVQIYLVASLLLKGIAAQEELTHRALRPNVLLLGSFLLLIVAGTLLLMLPLAHGTTPQGGRVTWRWVDALFTATSAACVTGLAVKDTGGDLSFRGQAVLLGLIQVGGLGLVTLTMLVSFLRHRSFQLRQMTLVRDVMNVNAIGGLGRLLAVAALSTVLVELIGAVLLFHARSDIPHLGDRAWWSLFHSVSAFCNAGFSTDATNLEPYAARPGVLLPLAGLIIVGGLGFPVVVDLLRFELRTLPFIRRFRWKLAARDTAAPSRLSLHTKLVLVTNGVLIVVGMLLFFAAESQAPTLRGMPRDGQMVNSFFQSVTTRTAGFNSVSMGALQLPTILLFLVLMAIGASPVSTGGGIKTSTAAVMLLTVRSMIRGRDHVEAFHRTIPRRFVNGAVAVIAFYVCSVLGITTILVLVQPSLPFMSVLFESVSAVSTVGLSTGITPGLNDAAKVTLCLAMFIGRVGPLAILWSVMAQAPALRYEYPEEAVIVS